MKERGGFGVLDDLFTKALDLPPEQQAAFITQISESDAELANALKRLLSRAGPAQTFLGEDAEISRDALLAQSLESVHAQAQAGGLKPGDTLGPYTIEDTIGRGLRSVVYLATRQEADWSQQVAIKVLARGVNTDDVYRRFLAERRILTALRYPGISILLDGGVTDDGLPFFVMEHIDGLSITEYCQRNHLNLGARVQLFRQVCEAVAHAHRHLVVHRDIKPSNILVTDDGQVKLLDFGIAKLLEPVDSEAQYLTAADARPMTPAYSTPEQNSGGTVTTATDVYQLGLLLAEILTGTGPAREKLGIETGGLPARPPSKIQGLESLPYSASELRGDLDWIVLRALEPAPESRYASAASVLADIDRYQNRLPVSARSWTVPYVTRKFVRRRPGLALAAGVATVGIVAYAIMVGYFNVTLEKERQAAVEAATQAQETRDLLIRFLTSPDPMAGMGADTTVSDLLAHSESVLLNEFQHRPELQAELFAALADVYLNLDIPDRAIELRTRELQLRRGMDASQSLPILLARSKLASAQLQTGAVKEALDGLYAVHAELVDRHPDAQPEIARVKTEIGTLLGSHGDPAIARPYLEDAIAILRKSGNEPVSLASALVAYADVFEDYATSLDHLEAAHELKVAAQGAEHPNTLDTSAQIAAKLTDLGRYADSLRRYEVLIPAMEREFGPLHTQTISVLNNRAVTLYFAGEIERAIRQHQEILARKRQKYGGTHPLIADSLQNIGALQVAVGRHQEAIEALREAAEIYEVVHLPGSPVTAYPHISLAGLYSELNRPDELEHHARRAIELLEGNVSETHVALLKSRCLLGDALIRKGQADQGIPMVQTAIDGMIGQTRLAPRHIEQCRGILQRGESPRAESSGGVETRTFSDS